ncbi:DUF3068 domain-containing protein [Antrihabitans sp. YC2-6]|uniref:DUF3068 domain-containing protein n=1 Tax=Antrihabitans sp. YC2-6 TaxID=2799498 RepID=UPI0018F2935A|nr:DUF3068 domain-containing protein [Antrihabitans sp. YC2-6]MBJ8347720.1 DUF3068 domain-containing protein [Antrihabitans sp. YC2-6]
MAEGSDTRRPWAFLLLFFGALLLVAAVLLPTYALGQLKKTPLDLRITTIAETQGKTGTVADAKSLLNTAAKLKVDEQVPIISQRFLTVEEPSNADEFTVQAGSTLRRTDVTGNTGLLTASVDLVTLDRKTGEALAEPIGSIQTDFEGPFVPVEHKGLLWRFPFDTEKKSYDYFDLNTRETNPIDYIEETEINGTKVYKFQQTIAPTKMADHVQSPVNSVTKSAENWGVEPNPGQAPDAPITMDRYYTNIRTIWVEPETGTVIKGSEEPHQYFARDANREPEKSLLKAALTYNEETIESQIERAKDGTDQLSLIGRTIPIVLGIVGILLLIAGLVLGLRGGSNTVGRRRANGGPSGYQPAGGAAPDYSTDRTEEIPRQNLDGQTDVIRRPNLEK